MRHQTTIEDGSDGKLVGHAIITWIDRSGDWHCCSHCEAKNIALAFSFSSPLLLIPV